MAKSRTRSTAKATAKSKRSAAGAALAQETSPEQIRQLYERGIRQVTRVLGSVNSTDAEIETAEQTLKDLTTSMLAHEIESVQGRTALLSGLIVELTTVVDSIQTNSPLAEVVSEVNDILDVARTALTEEKKGLLS
jgi:prefoldin subunit 5